MAVHPEHGFLDPQDLRRFDLVVCVAKDDQSEHEVVAGPDGAGHAQVVSADLLRESILWAWTRRREHCLYAPGAEAAIKTLAQTFNARFGSSEIPLLITDAHEKVARHAFAFSALLHSTDERHEQIVVTPVHVALVGRLVEAVYMHPNCALDQYATVLRRRGGLDEVEYEGIRNDLLTPGSNREDPMATEALLDLFLTEDDLPRADLEAATGLGREALSNRIGKLRRHRLIQSGRRGYRKTARFVAFLRRWAETRANTANPPRSGAGASLFP